jgi:hypothetical protein
MTQKWHSILVRKESKMSNNLLIPEEFFLNIDFSGVLQRSPEVLYALKKCWRTFGYERSIEEKALTLILAHLCSDDYQDFEYMSSEEMFEKLSALEDIELPFIHALESLVFFKKLDVEEASKIEDVEQQLYLTWAMNLMSPWAQADLDLNQCINFILDVEQTQGILSQLGYERSIEMQR